MKKIVLYSTAALALAFSSCKDFLQVDSPSTMTSETVYQSVDYANNAILGIYANFGEDRLYAQSMSVNMPTGSDIEFMKFSQDKSFGSFTGPSTGEARQIGNYFATTGTTYLATIWTQMYRTIEFANLAIYGIENSPLLTSGTASEQNKMRGYLAEAVTLRAWCYMELARVWGNVPFKLEPSKSDGSNYYLPKTDVMVIYQTLVEQLDEVADFLPWGTSGGSKERIQRGFVKGLTARIALYRAGYYYTTSNQWKRMDDYADYYRIAYDRCHEIMENGLHKLNTGDATRNGFQNLFYTQCQRKNDPFNESLYEIGMGYTTAVKSGEIGHLVGIPFVTGSAYGKIDGQVMVPMSYLYSFDPADTRRDMSVAFSYNKDGKQVVPNTTGGAANPQDLYVGKWSLKWMTEDYIKEKLSKGDTKIATGINFCLMRYADVLLMYAEAANMINDMEGAKAALQQVRERAFPANTWDKTVTGYLATLSDQPKFQAAIENERMWEFVGEGIRKYDLIRWGKLADAIKTTKENCSKIFFNHQNPYYQSYVSPAAQYPAALPVDLWFNYKSSDAQDIDFSTARFYDPTAPGSGFANNNPWLVPNGTDFGTTASYYFLDEVVGGLVRGVSEADYNEFVVYNQCPYRPLASSTLSDSRGTLKNDYGFAN